MSRLSLAVLIRKVGQPADRWGSSDCTAGPMPVYSDLVSVVDHAVRVYEHLDPGPAPAATSPATARVMARMRTSGTEPELALRRELHRMGLRFVVNRAVPGGNPRRRADILFRGPRIAVFVDGCFWHSCPCHGRVPKSHSDWWRRKFHSIANRDHDTDARLKDIGWMVIRVWEHEDSRSSAERIRHLVLSRGKLKSREVSATRTT